MSVVKLVLVFLVIVLPVFPASILEHSGRSANSFPSQSSLLTLNSEAQFQLVAIELLPERQETALAL